MSDMTLLLVHGAWHGPWFWQPVQIALADLGLGSATLALPSMGLEPARLGGLFEDIDAVQAAVAKLPGQILIVAHSYGGMVVSGAHLPRRVRGLVYLGAFMPEVKRSLVSYLPEGPLPAFVKSRDDACSELNLDVVDAMFYADCTPALREQAKAQLTLHSTAAITTPVPRASWREFPSTYIVLTQDQVIPVAAQRQMAVQASASLDFDSSHSPMWSRPAQLAAVLAELAHERKTPSAARVLAPARQAV